MRSQIHSRHSMDWRPPAFFKPELSLGDVRRLSRRPAIRGTREWRPGLGQSGIQLSEEGISLATTGVAVGASIAGAAAIGAIAGPIGAVAGVLVALLASVFKGCGSSCTLTSDAANQIEQALQQNLEAYMSSGHTEAEQAAALANFDNTWAQLEQYCGQASFGSAGQNCISDRQQGSCHYKTAAGGWQQTDSSPTPVSGQSPPVVMSAAQCGGKQWIYVYPGPEGSGSTCWDWFVGYRDPIATDPCVIANSASPVTAASVTGTGTIADDINSIWSDLTGGSTSNLAPLLIVGALILAAVLL